MLLRAWDGKPLTRRALNAGMILMLDDRLRTAWLDNKTTAPRRRANDVGLNEILTDMSVDDFIEIDNQGGQHHSHEEPDFSTWQKIVLLIAPGTDHTIQAELLRPREWFLSHGAIPDATIHIDLEEMGVQGPAFVQSIEPCPEIESGEGRVITGTFQHLSGNVYDLLLESEPHPIGVTGTHPIWSMDRLQWVPVKDLEPGEKVLTLSGTTEVLSILFRDEQVPVYNIEVDGDHVYRVGESGVLVHNASIPTTPPKAGQDFGCGKLSGQGNLERDAGKLKVENEDLLKRLVGWEKHHLIEVRQAPPILKRAAQLRYDINREHNGIALPSYGENYKWKSPHPRAGKPKTCKEGQLEALEEDWPLHKGRHSHRKYGFCVKEHLDKLKDDYVAGAVTDCDLCQRLYEIEEKLLEALLEQKIYLNRYDPHMLKLTAASLSGQYGDCTGSGSQTSGTCNA